MKFLIASLKTFNGSKIIKFLFWLSFAQIGPLFQCTFIAGFWDNLQDPRWVSEQQQQQTQAAIRKPEQAL
jgi:hypothetical protein